MLSWSTGTVKSLIQLLFVQMDAHFALSFLSGLWTYDMFLKYHDICKIHMGCAVYMGIH